MSLSNLLTNIRNGQIKRILVMKQPKSKVSQGVLQVMQENGYIRGYRLSKGQHPSPSSHTLPEEFLFRNRKKKEKGHQKHIEILLKYKNKKPAINQIKIISKPSRRVYKSLQGIQNLSANQNPSPIDGLWIVSTSKGILSREQACQYNLGGEILCHVT